MRGAVLAFVVGTFFVANSAAAQSSTGGIRGTVRDDSGGALPGVSVEASSPSLIGGPAVTVTDESGQYRFDRLAVGTYAFRFSISGFRQSVRNGVVVEVGRTVDVDVVMAIGALEETVMVSGAAPVVDSLHASTMTNFNAEILDELPSARVSWFNTVGFAPAMRADPGNFASASFIMYGSSVDQNSFQLEGIDYVSPSGNSMYDRPNPDSVQEIQVKSVGASAEESGFQGGIVNIILKTGSNQWRGHLSNYYINKSWVSNNTPEARLPFQIGYFNDVTASFGGPIIRDRLWAMAMFEDFRSHEVQVGVALDLGPKTRRTKPALKINARLSTNDTLDFAYSDSFYDTAGETSALRPAHTISMTQGRSPAMVLRWGRTIGNRSVLEVKGGGIYSTNYGPPRSDDYDTSGRYDAGTGQFSGNAMYSTTTPIANFSGAISLAHNASTSTGDHDLKVGLQWVPVYRSETGQVLIGGRFYYDNRGQPDYVLERDPTVVAGRTKTIGGYVQDNWTIGGRVTLNLGVRFDHVNAGIQEATQFDVRNERTNQSYPGLDDLIVFDNVSPRVGATWKLDTSGRTVAKVAYGRYYGRLATNTFSVMAPGNTPLRHYFYNPETGQYDIPYFTVDPRRNFSIDPDLKNQFTDQLFVGLERELLPGVGLNLNFVRKKESNLIRVQDVAGEYVEQAYLDPFDGRSVPVWNLVSPSSQSQFQVRNRNDFKQDYRTFVAQLTRRMAGRWQAVASYQWERAWGVTRGDMTLASQTFSTLNADSVGRDPNDLTNTYGPFYAAATHTARANVNAQLPWDISIGVQESFETGRPYGRVVTIRNLGQGNRVILAEPRGAYRLDATNNLQVRVAKDFRMTGAHRLRISVDAYNVFNADSPLTVRNDSSQPNFGQTLSVFTPRRFQLGVRYDF